MRAMNGPQTAVRPARWAGTGYSDNPDSAQAGAEAVADAMSGRSTQLVILFASAHYDVAALAAAASEAAGDAQVIGCTSAGESGSAPASITALALGGPGFSVATASSGVGNGRGLRDAGELVAGALERVAERPHKVLIMLTDGLLGDPQEVIRGAYSVAGPGVPLVGGLAGHDLRLGHTWQFHGGRALRGGVVAAAVSSMAPFGVGVRHGWKPSGQGLMVTEADGTVIRRLDDRPALDVYLERLGAPADLPSDPNAFAEFVMGHPLGVAGASACEMQIRSAIGVDVEERSIRFMSEMPSGNLIWTMRGDTSSVTGAARLACRAALYQLGGRPPVGLLAVHCVSRRAALNGKGPSGELARIAMAGGGAPVAGFHSYGEIARTRGPVGLHNGALVVLAIG